MTVTKMLLASLKEPLIPVNATKDSLIRAPRFQGEIVSRIYLHVTALFKFKKPNPNPEKFAYEDFSLP